MSQKQGQCPHCGENSDMTSANPARPFCSKRCQRIDLGDWADERHSIPGDDSQPWPANSGDSGSSDGIVWSDD